jgi:hypothetical protein
MTQPAADYIHLDSCLEKMNRRRMAEYVRADPPPAARTNLHPRCVTADDLIDAEPGERATNSRAEDGRVSRSLQDERPKEPGRLVPDGTGPPFVAFAMQAHARASLEIHMLDPEISDLLHAGTGIVEEDEKGAISVGQPAFVREAREERPDLVPLEEARLRRRRALWESLPPGGTPRTSRVRGQRRIRRTCARLPGADCVS